MWYKCQIEPLHFKVTTYVHDVSRFSDDALPISPRGLWSTAGLARIQGDGTCVSLCLHLPGPRGEHGEYEQQNPESTHSDTSSVELFQSCYLFAWGKYQKPGEALSLTRTHILIKEQTNVTQNHFSLRGRRFSSTGFDSKSNKQLYNFILFFFVTVYLSVRSNSLPL